MRTPGLSPSRLDFNTAILGLLTFKPEAEGFRAENVSGTGNFYSMACHGDLFRKGWAVAVEPRVEQFGKGVPTPIRWSFEDRSLTFLTLFSAVTWRKRERRLP